MTGIIIRRPHSPWAWRCIRGFLGSCPTGSPAAVTMTRVMPGQPCNSSSKHFHFQTVQMRANGPTAKNWDHRLSGAIRENGQKSALVMHTCLRRPRPPQPLVPTVPFTENSLFSTSFNLSDDPESLNLKAS